MDQNIKQRSRQLAAKVILLHKQLSARKKGNVMSEELLRCGAGVGASLVKSECAMGRNDQTAKIYKALQDCVEAKYWLELLNEAGNLTEFEFSDTLNECSEMGKQLVAQIKSLGATAPK